ncbi:MULTISPECIES: adenine phosphoribosyltransferase [unclassified Mucilaginibacter]|uniref:adenine phosphoribosyltransferase n=1 Tax=unclassified Mucilaginibacter TaxID=2617802 RepID=UPI002AC8E9C2|nr:MULTISPECIES: adenine phosphoribosyltransferase [unclassified Mucilaginibacter]MEB0262418.1 adenine phosphoribosyltransferase [Mucilaginibacter sp. 10I4]MEB0277925.1 adenine phosphoribosyltransferase [Mucilaginibacter sp. 10B2]MEB0299722.1 adenine phosphoribosyltransferase [Mucilaginibacter sp. 5C4]WPX22816.1 adenine phosphoribosyltransferase [Mucilaginibacter sp. 5C4]
MIEQQIKTAIRDIHDFPKPGIIFKDITPILKDPQLCSKINDAFLEKIKDMQIDAIAGVESRGFLFGLSLATKLGVPFIPVRKAGKLPYTVNQKVYELEYGTATIEIHTDAFNPGDRILIHDDLLATGGTVTATSELIQDMGGIVAGFSFVVGLSFLKGVEKISPISNNIIVLADY